MRPPQGTLVLNHELTVNNFCSCKHFLPIKLRPVGPENTQLLPQRQIFCFLHLLDTLDIINLDYS